MSQSLSVTDYMHWFRHAAPYIHAHQNKTFVILLTGEAIEHEDNLQSIIHDLTLLHSLNIRLVLVFGAKPQINHALAQSNINSEFVGHRRITPRQSLPNLLNAVGTVRLKLEALLSMGLANSPMYQARIHVVSGNLVTAKPYGIHDGIDFQLTGEVRSINAKQIQDYLAQHSIVLLSQWIKFRPKLRHNSGCVLSSMTKNSCSYSSLLSFCPAFALTWLIAQRSERSALLTIGTKLSTDAVSPIRAFSSI